jgi:predicted RNA binding protein YcfA (HicA-like mRNA interferase family)
VTKRDKRIERLRQNPRNVRFEELDTLLRALGFERRQQGSHVTYSDGSHQITVPIRKPFMKPIYIKFVLRMIDELDDSES